MPLLFPVLAVLIWAANTVVNKLAAGAIAPAEIGFYRWLLAALLFTPFMFKPLLQHRAAIRAQAGKIVVLGLMGMVLYQTLAYFAAHSTSATNMGIILSLMPMMALALSIGLLGQRLTWGAITGSVVSFAGVLLVVSGGSIAALLRHGVGSGDALMLIATLAYALYSVLLKKWQIQLPSLLLLYLQVLVAVVLLLPLYLASPKVGLSAANIPLVLYAALFASMLAPLLWMRGVAQAGPSRTTLLFNLSPVFTALIAATPILHEQLAWYHLVGGVLTLAGVLLSERWKQPLPRMAVGVGR
ncbi:DMT family transporter [Jeongeupia wiesaeckerbachi]|uniref:DMT family transporter n=1 Tax=Jeongeupia wiesaeckerbachi TaxID=3051218 RepID=UPI003D807336